MSTAELQTIQNRDEAFCDTGRPGPDPSLRTYIEAGPRDVLQYFVDPVAGSDARDGRTLSTAFRTLTRALCEIRPVRLTRADELPPEPMNSYEINLLPGVCTAANERGAIIPAGLSGMEAYFSADSSLVFNHRAGSLNRPIIIQGHPAGGVPPAARPAPGSNSGSTSAASSTSP